MIIELEGLAPAAEEGWATLFDLNEVDSTSCLLVGGQMMQLLSVEHAAPVVRPTDDVDVVVDVRTRPQGTRWLAGWLQERGFTLEGSNPDQIGHRFVRPATGGPGKVIVDVLGPEGVGPRASLVTVPPNRTVQVPGSVQALRRSRVVSVRISGLVGRPRHRVDLLDEELPGAERRERPGERDSSDVDGDADLVDLDGQ